MRFVEAQPIKPLTYTHGLLIGERDRAERIAYRTQVHDPSHTVITPTMRLRPEIASFYDQRRDDRPCRIEQHVFRGVNEPVTGQIILIVTQQSVVSVRLPHVDRRPCCPMIARIARFLRARLRR